MNKQNILLAMALGIILSVLMLFVQQEANAQCASIPIPTVQGLNPAYTTLYVLTDLSGNIVATASSGSFTTGNPYSEGTYNIFALNYSPTNPPATLPTIGSSIANYQTNAIAGCYKLSEGVAYNCGCRQICYQPSTTFVYTVTATNNTASYSTRYFLTNASGVILASNTTGNFTADVTANFPTVSTFHVHYLNYITTDFPNPPLANGANISTIGAGCRNADFEEDYICFSVANCCNPNAGDQSSTAAIDNICPLNTGLSGAETVSVNVAFGGVLPATGYVYLFYITDANGIIKQIITSATYNAAAPANFTEVISLAAGLSAGTYYIRGLNYNPTDPDLATNGGTIALPAVGADIDAFIANLTENDGTAIAPAGLICGDINMTDNVPFMVNNVRCTNIAPWAGN